MSRWLGWCWIVACTWGTSGRRAPTTVTCDDGTTLRDTAPDAEIATRFVPGTRVLQCLDGSSTLRGEHLERYPGDPGGVAVEGQWRDGARDGTWTTWRVDGAFARRATFEAGQPVGDWLEVGADGRVTVLSFEDGVVVGLSSLPTDTEMPEWTEGIEKRGRRYQGGGHP